MVTQHIWVLACPSAVPTLLSVSFLLTHSSCSFMAPTHPSLRLTQGLLLRTFLLRVSLLLPLMLTLILSPCLRFRFCRRKNLNCSVGPHYSYELDFSHWATSQSSDQPRCCLSVAGFHSCPNSCIPGPKAKVGNSEQRTPLKWLWMWRVRRCNRLLYKPACT